MAGKVIGVTTAIFPNTGTFSGIGFAIPSNNVQMIVPQLNSTWQLQAPMAGNCWNRYHAGYCKRNRFEAS